MRASFIACASVICGLLEARELQPDSFVTPSARQRARFRYWIPDASIDLGQVREQIQEVAAVGAGGVEVLGYYAYGGNIGSIASDGAIYGWGLPAWKAVQDTILGQARISGLVVDLALGPNQGAGVPAPYNDEGRIWQLVSYNVTVPLGQAFDAFLPGWGSGRLVAATKALVVETVPYPLRAGGLLGAGQTIDGFRATLATTSLADVTAEVTADGYLQTAFPSETNGLYNVIFAFYLNQPDNHEVPPFNQTPITQYTQNGSWVVDHFSARGAQTVIDFWEQHLLDDENKQLLREVGNFFWEDSQEYGGESAGIAVFWTPDLLASFQNNRGYSVAKFIPLLLYNNNGFDGMTVYNTWFVTDQADGGASIVADYRQTLTELNTFYLKALRTWANSLGMQFSAQVGYNLEEDMLALVPEVDAPELESLAFNNDIDSYVQYTGPGNLAGKRVISSELGALLGQAYTQVIPQILWEIKRSLVASVNQFVLHGLAFKGTYPTCTWPSFTTFDYLFSEQHGSHLPAWDFYSDWLNWTARNQYVQQQSIPKFDIAFWLKNDTYDSSVVTPRYLPVDLMESGYTYQYLSPDNFALPAAVVRDNVLAPEAQSFKALVLRANDTLTSYGVNKLQEYAEAGLPIIFSGGLPSKIFGFLPEDEASINETVQALTEMQNVHVVPYEGLADSIARVGVLPRSRPSMNGSLLTHWSTGKGNVDYVFIYNDASAFAPGEGRAVGNISFKTDGSPIFYDAWTGRETSLQVFSQDGLTTTVPLSVAGNQSIILAFDRIKSKQWGRPRICSTSPSILDVQRHSRDGYTAKLLSSETTSQLNLCNGKVLNLPYFQVPPVVLTNWSLTIESWLPPADISDSGALSVRRNTSYSLTNLVTWDRINTANLKGTAGRGYYSTTFQWPPAGHDIRIDGAILDLGFILHTATVSINGKAVPPLDVTDAKADIGCLLRRGVNLIEVVTASPLGNALQGVSASLHCLLPISLDPGIVPTSNGLAVDIVLFPYATATFQTEDW